MIEEEFPLFDTGTRKALIDLLRGPFLDAEKRPSEYAAVDQNEAILRRYLLNLNLDLLIDRAARIAYVRQAEDQEGGTLLRQSQLDEVETRILIYLRQELSGRVETGNRVVVRQAEVEIAYRAYSTGTDKAAEITSIGVALDKLEKKGFVSKVPGSGGLVSETRWVISPIVGIIFSTDMMKLLKAQYEQVIKGEGAGSADEVETEEEEGEVDQDA